MKQLDKSINFYPIGIYIATSVLIIVLIISSIWLSGHKVVTVSISPDGSSMKILTEGAVNVKLISIVLIMLILISFPIIVITQFVKRKTIIMELTNLTCEMKNKNSSYITKVYKYQEFESIKDSYNQKIKLINRQVEKKDEYFKMTVHDLRSPIQGVKSNVALLEKFPDDPEIFEDLREDLIHLENEVTRYLVLEKIDYFEKADIHNQNINQIINHVVKRYSEQKYKIVVDEKMQLNAYVDTEMFEKIIINLVQNGVMYSPDHKIIVTIEEDHVMFCNKVNHLVERIFSEKRVKSANGNGLGTQIILKYIQLQNLTLEEINDNNQVCIIIRFKE